MFPFGKDDNWYERDNQIETYLVLNYEIWPSQVLLYFNLFKTKFIIFRTKFDKRIKLLKIK